MRTQRNKILHTIKNKLLRNRESEIDNKVKEINDMQDHTKMMVMMMMTMMVNVSLIQTQYIKLFEIILVSISTRSKFQISNHSLEIQHQ